jgi:tetratricopeptide (TPR) repeat protein
LEAASGEDCLVEAELQIEMGYIMMQLGDYDDASNAVEQGLDCLPEGPSKLRSFALLQLGSICSRQQQSELCLDYTVRALEIAEQVHDYFQMLYCLINLAIDKSTAGQWHDAITDFQQAAALAERLGHEKSRLFLELNLGVVKLFAGDNENAQRHLLRCLEMAREKNDRLVQVVAQTNLSSLWLRLGDLDAAHEALHSAERLAVEINARHSLIETYKTQAELHLAMTLVPASLDYAERAVQLAEELGAESGQGACYRVWGRALFADGQQQKAFAKFEQSLSLLEHDPYERAQTQMHYGQALASSGDESRGAALIEQARQAFQQLQAEFDLVELEALSVEFGD